MRYYHFDTATPVSLTVPTNANHAEIRSKDADSYINVSALAPANNNSYPNSY